MYEDYLQNYHNYPLNEIQNTYEGMDEIYPYWYSQDRNAYDYNYIPFNYQSRGITNSQIEDLYPDVYKIIYPMVKRVLNKNNNRAITQDVIENMVEEVYSNVEDGGQIELNREAKQEEKEENKKENRGHRRNNNLLDIIKILLLREILGRTGCNRYGCRPNMPPLPPRPPFYNRPPFSA